MPIDDSGYSDVFSVEGLSRFRGAEAPDTFFDPSRRSYLTHTLLNTVKFADGGAGVVEEGQVNVNVGMARMARQGWCLSMCFCVFVCFVCVCVCVCVCVSVCE